MQINYIVRKTVLGKGATACKAARELSQTIKTMKSIGTFTKKAAGSKSFSLTKSALTEIEKKTVRDYAPIAFGHVSVLDNIFQGGIIDISQRNCATVSEVDKRSKNRVYRWLIKNVRARRLRMITNTTDFP